MKKPVKKNQIKDWKWYRDLTPANKREVKKRVLKLRSGRIEARKIIEDLLIKMLAISVRECDEVLKSQLPLDVFMMRQERISNVMRKVFK